MQRPEFRTYTPRLYHLVWLQYLEQQRMIDLRFGILAEIGWNAAFTERKSAADFFPSLKQALAKGNPPPQTAAEARKMKRAQGAALLAKMKQQFG